MDRINVETEYIQANGFQLPQGKCDVRIERAMFDTNFRSEGFHQFLTKSAGEAWYVQEYL